MNGMQDLQLATDFRLSSLAPQKHASAEGKLQQYPHKIKEK
jgi:hypothetical protein